MQSEASSIYKCCYACQWLDNVDMYMNANFDQNIRYGSRAIHIFTKRMDRRTHLLLVLQFMPEVIM